MVQFARCLHGMTRAKFKFLNQCIFFINFEDSASNFGYVNRFVPSDIKIRREPVGCLKLQVIDNALQALASSPTRSAIPAVYASLQQFNSTLIQHDSQRN